ncbi:PEP-CTERM sorting domain-containing protein [Pseudoduganella sp. GCM10020061]|uniref:PEP-CTERM sorting domain-containing protein n=1 Tax=Pseudoduganella sp. GCM10020061 TaxID=3317345 RepID=UPI00363A4E86
MKLKAGLASLAALSAAPAMAEVVVINFDTMANNVFVNNYYSGGTDGRGNWGTIDRGVSFIGFITAPGVGATSTPNYAYSNSPSSFINVSGGFSAFNFTYGTLSPATISVYSGLNGTGTLLGSGVFNGNAMAFQPGSIGFAGIGHSVMLTARPNYAALDDVAFTYPAPIPEPQTWAMLLAGLLLTRFAARRR